MQSTTPASADQQPSRHSHKHELTSSHPTCCSNAAEEEESPEVLEQQALGKIIFALQQYSVCSHQEIDRWEHNYAALSARHRAILSHLPAKAAAARRAVQQNQLFIKAMLMNLSSDDDDSTGDGSSGDGDAGVPGDLSSAAMAYARHLKASGEHCSPGDAEKVRYVLKNLVRDWSAEGAIERQQCFGKLVDHLKSCFESWTCSSPPRVLLPGAGLGRLCVEVAAAGFEAQGNEFSYFMLLTAAFILNSTSCAEQWTIHPWVHITCNNVTNEDQLRAVCIPDVVPSSITPPGLLSMCAGDFVEVYSQPSMASSFDAVVTCFFIDTAHNVLEYLEVIHKVLKPGGYWIHLGPLLWHWADGNWDELSVELSLLDIQQAAQLMGFKMLRHEFVDAAYIANIRSMYKTVYQAASWTMQKTQAQLPEDLNELVRVLAVTRQQQQQAMQQRQQPPPPSAHSGSTAAATGKAAPSEAKQGQQQQPQPGQQHAPGSCCAPVQS